MPKIEGRKDTRREFEVADLLWESGGFWTSRKSAGRCCVKGCGHVVKSWESFALVVQREGYDPNRPVRAGIVCEEHGKMVLDAWGYDAEALEPPF